MPASHATTLSRTLARLLADELPRRFPRWGALRQIDLIAGGFSGASLFRVASEAGSFAVKLSPAAENLLEATAARHRVIEQIAARLAADRLPPLFPHLERDASGATVGSFTAVSQAFVVEARDWLEDKGAGREGAALLDRPTVTPARRDSDALIASAFKLLARFHQAARRVVLTDRDRTHLQAATPLPERYVQEWRLAARTNLAAIEAGMDQLPLDLRDPARNYLSRLPARERQIGPSLSSLPGSSPGLCLCLRDAHRNNIAYRNEVAREFFDWDALRFDRRVGDFARLSASFGVEADEAENLIVSLLDPESPIERWTAWESAALRPILATQVWLPPLNWLRWLLVEERAFDDPPAAFSRLRETLHLAILRPFSIGEA